MGKRLCNGDFFIFAFAATLERFKKDQCKLPKSLLVDRQCLDRVMFCLKPFDSNDFSVKLTTSFMFPNRHFCVKI